MLSYGNDGCRQISEKSWKKLIILRTGGALDVEDRKDAY